MKKIFGSLAVLAILFTAVACDHGTSSKYAEGSISGKPVYDAGGSKWSDAEITLNLSGASFAENVKTTKTINATVYGSGVTIGQLKFTPNSEIKAGATSATFTISDAPTLKDNYNGAISFKIDNSTDIFKVDDGKLLVDDQYILVSGELEIKNYASAKISSVASAVTTGSTSDATITIELTGATYKQDVSSSITVTRLASSDGATEEDLTVTAAAVSSTPDNKMVISVQGTGSAAVTFASGDLIAVSISAPGTTNFTADSGKALPGAFNCTYTK